MGRFDPPPPSGPATVSDAEVRRLLERLLDEISDLSDAVEAIDVAPQVTPTPVVVEAPPVDLSPIASRLDELGQLLASLPAPVVNVPPSQGSDLSPLATLVADVKSGIEALTARVGKMETPTMVGGSQIRDVNVRSASGDRVDPSTEGTLLALKNRADLLATETTLAALAAEDFATQATLADVLTKLTSIDDALNNTDNTTQAAGAAVSSGAWTDIVTLSKASAITVVGFNADVDSILDIRYRYRLQVDGVTKLSEVITSGQLSYIAVQIDVAANATVKVQVFHNDVSPTDFQAAIAYRE